MKKYKVVISYEVQKTFVLDAKNQDEAFDKADGASKTILTKPITKSHTRYRVWFNSRPSR